MHIFRMIMLNATTTGLRIHQINPIHQYTKWNRCHCHYYSVPDPDLQLGGGGGGGGGRGRWRLTLNVDLAKIIPADQRKCAISEKK